MTSRAKARKLASAALFGVAALMTSGAALAQEPIDLTIDFAKLMKLSRPATTIVIGNPGIADATVEENDTLVLTGRAAGVTNLIVLDENGEEVTNATVRVSSDVRQLTTVFYGVPRPKDKQPFERHTFSCAPVCEKVISVGDAEQAFGTATAQIQGRTQFATGQ